MTSKYPSIKKIYINLDESPDIGAEYSVFIAPTILLFILGKESLRESRFIILSELEKKIVRYLNFLC